MARKSIKGYAEKNYYDNTRFSGGIVATNDPLNEGYFKHMVNFNISDTGASVEPRKGFFTTTFKIDDVIYTLSDKTIYFYDASLGRHIFIDFLQTINSETPLIISADFDIDKKYLTNAELITKFDWETLKDYNINTYRDISFLQDKAELAIDKYGINRYIIKAELDDDGSYLPIWVSFVYRKNGSTYEGVTYEADTLVMEYLNFSDTVSINMADRNLASFQSIIPVPIQAIYPSDELPLDFIQQFPLIYVKGSDNKYYINTIQKKHLNGLQLIPYFNLEEPEKGYDWYYTYDIISTDPGAGLLDSKNKFESDIFSLKNTPIVDYNKDANDYIEKHPEYLEHSLYKYFFKDKTTSDIPWLHIYKAYTSASGGYESFNSEHNNIDFEMEYPLTGWKSLYYDYLKNINILNNKDYFKNNRATIIYIMPKQTREYRITCERDFYEIFNNTYNEDDIIDNVYQGRYIYKDDISLTSTEINGIVATDFWMDEKLRYIHNCNTVEDFLLEIQSRFNIEDYLFYVCHTDDTIDYNTATSEGFHHISQTALNSRICIFNTEEVLDFTGLTSVLKDNSDQHFIIKPFTNTILLEVSDIAYKEFDIAMIKMFPNIINAFTDDTNLARYFMCNDLLLDELQLIPKLSTVFDEYERYRRNIVHNRLFKEYYNKDYASYNEYDVFKQTYEPLIQSTWYMNGKAVYKFSDNLFNFTTYDYSLYSKNIFYKDNNNYLIGTIYNDLKNNTNIEDKELYMYLINNKFFENGVSIIFYLFKAPIFNFNNYYDRDYLIASTALKSNRQIILSTVEPTTIIEKLTEEPGLIADADNSLVFRSVQGDHLVVYNNNKVFISEANTQYYFKYDKMFEYPETVVKVIQYKDTLLVFTTQNLYSIYPIEVTENVQSGTDEEGNATYTQVTTIAYGNLPVLYNLLVNEKYKDAIQVYNQMVLFYSADGQMFMIKPTATIDNNTRFSIQYFNKNANDILLNYNYYMQERLKYYRYDDLIIDKDKVNIKVSVSLNYIKIFYCAPGIMTYILVYDIINNRYYTYDTLSFTDIKQLEFIPDGELYIVEYNKQLYFTQPYVIPNEVNSNVDRAFYNNFAAESIHSELDTGILNLNNHLKKRFRDLHIIYKNLDAQNIEFALDVFVDNVPISLAINTEIEIKNIGTVPTYNPSDIYSVTQLINKSKVELMSNNNALFDFSEFNSSKILTHKVSVISRGKHIRNKLCFKSEGKFKIQGYGLIYKEHTV